MRKLVEDVENYKEIMLKMKDTLVKERGEGLELKRKHEDTIFEFERLQKAYQDLEVEKYALEPVDYKTIVLEANAWGEFIEKLAGST